MNTQQSILAVAVLALALVQSAQAWQTGRATFYGGFLLLIRGQTVPCSWPETVGIRFCR